MSNLEFAVGKRVVCIRDDLFHTRHGERLPLLGCVYTIRDIFEPEHPVLRGYIGFLFEEIRNEPYPYIDGERECSFVSLNFRPVRDTSIDCFTKLLETPSARQTEPV